METNNNGLISVPAREYVLDDYTKGYSQCIDNNWMYAIYAQNPNVDILVNEFNAGFVQAQVQTAHAIQCARNNAFKNLLIGSIPYDQLTVTMNPKALAITEACALENYKWFYKYVTDNQNDPKVKNIIRLLYRMYGIWYGTFNEKPATGVNLTDMSPESLGDAQLKMGLGKDPLTFLDVYFVNCQEDLFDVVGSQVAAAVLEQEESDELKSKSEHCTGYVKFMPDGNIFWTHNTWSPFWAQSCAMTYCIGDDFVTQNSYCQGQFGSNNDFGFNKHGIGFNETTHMAYYDKPKALGLWIVWRSAAAEQFSTSIPEFYDYISMDNTGTYLNGYMIVDAYREQIGLIDMSYDRFAFFLSDGHTMTVTDSTGYKPNFLDWDQHLINPTHIFGVNQPCYHKIAYELNCMNTRPRRRNQLWNRLYTVVDMETCKDLITYVDPVEPAGIWGRWDLDFATTEFPYLAPDGSQDAKAFCTDLVKEVLSKATYKPSLTGEATSFWMRYGTPSFEGGEFRWSTSRFARFKEPQSEDFIPDLVGGRWNLVKMFME